MELSLEIVAFKEAEKGENLIIADILSVNNKLIKRVFVLSKQQDV
jgi:hypothetical protein